MIQMLLTKKMMLKKKIKNNYKNNSKILKTIKIKGKFKIYIKFIG